eukprot:331053-Rhodomonas_salina.10
MSAADIAMTCMSGPDIASAVRGSQGPAAQRPLRRALLAYALYEHAPAAALLHCRRYYSMDGCGCCGEGLVGAHTVRRAVLVRRRSLQQKTNTWCMTSLGEIRGEVRLLLRRIRAFSVSRSSTGSGTCKSRDMTRGSWR